MKASLALRAAAERDLRPGPPSQLRDAKLISEFKEVLCH